MEEERARGTDQAKECRLGSWRWGFPWKQNNSSKLQEREHLALGGGGWGKKPGRGGQGAALRRRSPLLVVLFQAQLVSCIIFKSHSPSASPSSPRFQP